jgi:hypothetical protein
MAGKGGEIPNDPNGTVKRQRIRDSMMPMPPFFTERQRLTCFLISILTTVTASPDAGAEAHTLAEPNPVPRPSRRPYGPPQCERKGCWVWGGGQGIGVACELEVNATGGAAPLGDGPHDQRLAALHVAGGEDARNAGHLVLVPPDIAALGHLHAVPYASV